MSILFTIRPPTRSIYSYVNMYMNKFRKKVKENLTDIKLLLLKFKKI